MVRGEVGVPVSIDGEKGTVKFEVEVTGGTSTWTDECMMRSDALALVEATIAGTHRGTTFDSR